MGARQHHHLTTAMGHPDHLARLPVGLLQDLLEGPTQDAADLLAVVVLRVDRVNKSVPESVSGSAVGFRGRD
jgi:hypothetical protein